MNETDKLIGQAAAALRDADAIVIGAGAGMGVDSGLPDFRGAEGFWKAYPPYARLGLGFTDLANAVLFRDSPRVAWGFYGHRLGLYRRTRPHRGFATLLRRAGLAPRGAFVFTSNVDGQFQAAGFDPEGIVEAHGSIHRMQCLARCGAGIFPSDPHEVIVDGASMRAVGPLPACPDCGSMARPNILMFGDAGWDSSHSDRQMARYRCWLGSLQGARILAIECGAGTAIPTVRWASEALFNSWGADLVRINPREPQVPRGGIGLPLGAIAAIDAIDAIR